MSVAPPGPIGSSCLRPPYRLPRPAARTTRVGGDPSLGNGEPGTGNGTVAGCPTGVSRTLIAAISVVRRPVPVPVPCSPFPVPCSPFPGPWSPFPASAVRPEQHRIGQQPGRSPPESAIDRVLREQDDPPAFPPIPPRPKRCSADASRCSGPGPPGEQQVRPAEDHGVGALLRRLQQGAGFQEDGQLIPLVASVSQWVRSSFARKMLPGMYSG